MKKSLSAIGRIPLKAGLVSALLMVNALYNVKAQITIDSSDYGSIGDTVILAVDSMPFGISVGNPGANQVWDFSNLGIDFYDTLKFMDPDSTTYGSNYPSSNLAIENSMMTPYMLKSDSELIIDGVYLKSFVNQPIDFAVNYENNQTILTFPSAYLTSFSDVAYLDTTFRDPQFGATIDSARLKRTIIVTSDFDAWGVVTSPAGTDSCLRQNRVEITVDSVWIKIFGTWNWFEPTLPLINIPNPNYDTSHVFSWWAKGKKFPVIELRTNNTGDTVRTANFIIGKNIIAFISNETNPFCSGVCEGQATVAALSGTLPYSFLWDANTGSATTTTVTGLCGGNYNVTVTDATGGTSVTTAIIIEPQPMTLTVTVNAFATCDTCNDGSATAVATGGSGNNVFTWSDGSLGATNSNLDTGYYSVMVSDGNGCTAQVDSVYITVGVEKRTVHSSKFDIYPNPVSESFNVFYYSKEVATVEISDLAGRVMSEHRITGVSQKISVSEFAPGLYTYRIINADRSAVLHGKISVIR